MMRIDRVETFLVPPRWVFCRVETDEGLVGWGEPVVEGRAEAVRAAVAELAEYLVGRDPLRVEDHWQLLSRGGFYRGGAVLSSALAGLDQALWDIAGKARGLPVHELLGGPVRDAVRVYGWVAGDEPGEVAETVGGAVAAGLTAVKMTASGKLPRLATKADVDAAVARAVTAREVLGPDRDLAIDVHGRASLATSRRLLAALEEAQVHPLFVEEPVLPEHTHLLPGLVAGTSIPIATGERLYSRSDFLPALRAGIAVAQPDLSHAGGITEVRRIASLAEVFDVALAPHCPLGPVALAASLQVDLLSPNFLIQEQSLGIHYGGGGELLDYLVDVTPFRFVDGMVPRPTGPGLGIEVDENAVRAAARVGHAWRSPVWRHGDGSLAEW
jgi:galactonate dehydratase